MQKMVDVIADEIWAEMLKYAPKSPNPDQYDSIVERIALEHGCVVVHQGKDADGRSLVQVQRTKFSSMDDFTPVRAIAFDSGYDGSIGWFTSTFGNRYLYGEVIHEYSGNAVFVILPESEIVELETSMDEMADTLEKRITAGEFRVPINEGGYRN